MSESRARWSCRVKGRPVPQSRLRMGNGRTYYLASSKKYRDMLVAEFRHSFQHMDQFECGVEIEVEICGARANGDLDNHGKMVLDALVTSGVIKDDCIKYIRRLELKASSAAKGEEGWTTVSVRELDS